MLISSTPIHGRAYRSSHSPRFIDHCVGLTPSATAGTTAIPTSAISERQILLENEGEHATKEELGHAE